MGKKEKIEGTPPLRPLIPPRVIGDFGGRRKTYERRLRRTLINHSERRDSDDRRSGYDRRGVNSKHKVSQRPGNRKNDHNDSEKNN